MRPPHHLLALQLFVGACGGVALSSGAACSFLLECPAQPGWGEVETIATATMGDLHALTRLSDYDAELGMSWDYLMVGSSGTIVVVGTSFDDSSANTFVEATQFGAVTLRAVTQVGNEWWIVGDTGLAAFTINRGLTWTSIVLGTTANLRDVITFADTMVIVGDGVIFVRRVDGTWATLESDAPEGWGELRSVYASAGTLYAAGLGGALWSTSDPAGTWLDLSPELEPSVDLLALGENESGAIEIVGAQGAMFRATPEGSWSAVETGLDVDLIAYEEGAVLTSAGQVLDLSDPAAPLELGDYAGALGLVHTRESVLTVVGELGMASTRSYLGCAD